MPKKCVAFGCSSVPSERISVHRFPKTHIDLKKWEKFVQIHRKDWKATTSSYMCSLHFQPSDYVDNDIKKSLGFNVM